MPLWGTRDSFSITGTVAVTNTINDTWVVGTGTAFTTEVNIGDTLVIAGIRRKVVSVSNNTYLNIDPVWTAANQSGATITGQDTPKYLYATDVSGNLIFGVSNAESFIANNNANGISTPGWIRHKRYTDMHGNARKKTEIIVAMTNLTSDAPDDDTVQDT
ncbi:hypothetical protein EB118_17455 [bacterium]|nr:hypothetical protein [bacterium]NDG31845.1 hypothetical protein [bacterium]